MPIITKCGYVYCPVCDQWTWQVQLIGGTWQCLQCRTQDRKDAFAWLGYDKAIKEN